MSDRTELAGVWKGVLSPKPSVRMALSRVRPRKIQSRTVLFVDDRGWDSFDQLAAALHRRGVRTVRVSVDPRAPNARSLSGRALMRRLADVLFYDETIILRDDDGERRLTALLESSDIADVIANEPTLKRIGLISPLVNELSARALACSATPYSVLLDKFEVNERLESCGLQVPRQVRADELAPAAAAQLLGLPLVVKGVTGAAGDQVRIASSPAAIDDALRELGGDPSHIFYQEYVEGTILLYASVDGPDGRLIDHGFRVEQVQYDMGPSALLRLADEPDLLALGRRVTAEFGCHGFSEFGFIRAPDGRLVHFDANFRISGMTCAPLCLGIDFISPYAAMITGASSHAPAWTADTTVDLPVLPFALTDAAAHGSAGDVARLAGMVWTRYAPVLGGRYLFYLAMAAVTAGVTRAIKWRTQPKSGSAAHEKPGARPRGTRLALPHF